MMAASFRFRDEAFPPLPMGAGAPVPVPLLATTDFVLA
jgi:hypothetical protein